MSNLIICGSKGYKKFSLNDLVDHFNFIVRNNMNIPGNNYGNKDSNVQVLNNHVFQHVVSNRDMGKYTKYTTESKIEEFKKYISSRKDTIRTFSNNNTQTMRSVLNKNEININIKKQIRCGLSYIAESIVKNEYPYLIGFSLNENEFNHQINSKLKNINDEIHDKNIEIKIIKKLHNKDLLDATFCSIIDSDKLILDCGYILPKKESIDILLKCNNEIELKNINSDNLSKLYGDYTLKGNKLTK